MDGIYLYQCTKARNELDAARRAHLLALKEALRLKVTREEVLTDLAGFDAAANALVALSSEGQ